MTSCTLTELLAQLDTTIRTLGTISVTGTLSDWRTHPAGRTTAELTGEEPVPARLRVVAGPHAAAAAADDLTDAGRSILSPGEVAVHGQLRIHPRFGLQLILYRLHATGQHPHPKPAILRPNATTRWPPTITTIGLVSPDGGDDAHADVHAVCDPAGLTIIDHRVAVTGPRAAIAIAHALDRLALDPRPALTLLVRGGGSTSDFAPFDSPIVTAAIGRHPRPVITGLGHADNHTTADDAAHTNCITPTAAAQLARDAHP